MVCVCCCAAPPLLIPLYPAAPCPAEVDDGQAGWLAGWRAGEARSSRRVMKMHSPGLIEGRAVMFHADSHM